MKTELRKLTNEVNRLAALVACRLPEPKPKKPTSEKLKDWAAAAFVFLAKAALVLLIAFAVLFFVPWSWWHVCTVPTKDQNPFSVIGCIISGIASIGIIICCFGWLYETAKDRISR